MPSDREGPVAGILLAAGTSSRMGKNKMLFELNGESVLRGAVRRALAGGLSPLVVVLGHEQDRARQELDGLPCQVVVNPDYEQGINSSLKMGVSAVPGEARAALVMLADMPYVSPEMLASLIARYRSSEAPLVISDYEGVNAPPMLYDRSLFDELLSMTGEGCGRQVVKRHREEAEVLPWPASALADIDLPEDYARVRDSNPLNP
ncbi:MAG TPA: nucleotidyltransferase family protein [Thermoanaerobaculia bacterium]|nr:nucleotidyltransferase family protein [Thermoanaerobaculia bacterium]